MICTHFLTHGSSLGCALLGMSEPSGGGGGGDEYMSYSKKLEQLRFERQVEDLIEGAKAGERQSVLLQVQGEGVKCLCVQATLNVCECKSMRACASNFVSVPHALAAAVLEHRRCSAADSDRLGGV